MVNNAIEGIWKIEGIAFWIKIISKQYFECFICVYFNEDEIELRELTQFINWKFKLTIIK